MEPDSDTDHSNTKPNENLNYVFFREKINQCRISLRLFNLERVFLHFQAEKNALSCFTWIYKLWQKLCGIIQRIIFHLTWWIGNGDLSHCRDLPYVRHVVFFRLFPWINFRFVQNMPRSVKSVELVDKWILSVFVVFFFSPKILAGAEEFGTLFSFVKKSV